MMQLAFSTLSFPKWTLDQVIDRAVEYGYAGVELRGLLGEFDLSKRPEFAPDKRDEVKKRFHRKNLEVVCVATSCHLSALTDKDRQKNLIELQANVQLAHDLGSKYIRVFPGHVPKGKPLEEYMENAALNLGRLVREGEKHNIYILVETHDGMSSSKRLGKLLDKVDHPFLA